jgi:AcrR family transcriptional regulator
MAVNRRNPRRDLAASARTRLLDAAEKLFADFGFNGVSVRQIVERAHANLGAIPYHFGTKENLFKQVLLRRAIPLREARKQLLAELCASGREPTLEEILYAMLEPAFRASRENQSFRRLLGRASTDPTPEVRRMLNEIYTLEFMIVPRVLREKLMQLSADEFYWKLNCFYGVMHFVQADTGKIQTIAGEKFDTSRPEIALKYVIPFAAAGFRAAIRPAALPNPTKKMDMPHVPKVIAQSKARTRVRMK